MVPELQRTYSVLHRLSVFDDFNSCVPSLPWSNLAKPYLGVNSAVFSVPQCSKRILSIRWVQVRPSRDTILSTVGWGAVTTRQRVMLIIIVPGESQISGVSLREVFVLEAITTLFRRKFHQGF